MLYTLKALSINFIKKCKKDELTVISGHLAFVTLLSFVPFITVILSIVSAFSFFSEAQVMIENFLFNQFVPEASADVQAHLLRFIENIGNMTGFSTAALVIIALMLLKNVDKELNRIFVTDKKKPLWKDLLIYFLVIILGPVLIGISIAATSAFLAIDWVQNVAAWFPGNTIGALLPVLFSFLYFLLLYRLVPSSPPSSQVAMLGALVTAILFEGCKYLFSWYISAFPTYQVIYGSLAAIPIFFVWIYFNWLVVLIGAEFTCVLEQTWQDKTHKTENNNYTQ
ncbi:YihY family inner membrane protein [Catenovulum sediminis]|uniref:YihY family inner membrane protein n=1 Tax=Catenovulum sediminis TaxID=1740262 RepID=A0ABV1RHR1_9ALTE